MEVSTCHKLTQVDARRLPGLHTRRDVTGADAKADAQAVKGYPPATVSNRMMLAVREGLGPSCMATSMNSTRRPLPTQPRPREMVFLLAKRDTIW